MILAGKILLSIKIMIENFGNHRKIFLDCFDRAIIARAFFVCVVDILDLLRVAVRRTEGVGAALEVLEELFV